MQSCAGWTPKCAYTQMTCMAMWWPSLFYQRLVGEGALETLPKERVAFLSGMMAITMCAILDKLGQYEFGVE